MNAGRAAYRGSRAMDIVVSSIALLALSPLIAAAALAVRWRMGSPVLFAQPRPGLHGKLFRLYKFRTMRDAAGKDGKPLPDADRLTDIGRWMRKWSVDELPELYNVLRGDMSLVGPRPLLPQYLGRYTAEQSRRHEVKPGLTGWAQVNGRNAITWEEKFALDVWYVDHRSFGLDLRILLRTMAAVARREGINAEGEATMPEFMGSPSDGKGSDA
ncbi:MAG: sugar transferase [Thermodesulfobacteriota bacterium]